MAKNSKEMYVVIAYRWGNTASHSYTLGVFDTKDSAIKCAESHATYRGGKYGCAVEKCTLNAFSNTKAYYTTEVYRAKSINE